MDRKGEKGQLSRKAIRKLQRQEKKVKNAAFYKKDKYCFRQLTLQRKVLENFYKNVEKKMGVKKAEPKSSVQVKAKKEEVKKKQPDGKVKAAQSWKELEKEVHVAEIAKLDRELAYLEKKLGVKGDLKKKQKLKNKFTKENFDLDILDFLDSIDQKVIGEMEQITKKMEGKGKVLPKADIESEEEEEEKMEDEEIEEDQQEEMQDEDEDEANEELGEEQEEYENEEENENEEEDEDEEEEDEEEELAEEEVESEEESENSDNQELQKPKSINKAEKEETKSEINLEDHKKKLKGIFNRLSEGNVEIMFEQAVKLIGAASDSSSSVRALQQLIVDSFILSAVLPKQVLSYLQPVYCAFIVGLSKILGEGILITTLKTTYQHFLKEEEAIESSNVKKNALYALKYFYQFGAIKGVLVLEILTELGKNLTASNIDAMSHYIQHIGFDLRKEEPLKLKDFIDFIEDKFNTLPEGDPLKKRMEYFEENLQNVKNNKKQPLYDIAREKIQPLATWLRTNPRIRSGIGSGPLNLTLKDLSETSAKPAEEKTIQRDLLRKMAGEGDLVGEMRLLEDIAVEQKMNTQIMKVIFTTMMTAVDHVDAFEKLIRLSLTSAQERDIIKVLVNCCGQEKYYNPFYALLGRKLCEYKNDFQYTFKYVMWDHMKNLHRYTLRKVNNLAKLFVNMVHTFALPIAILKALEFLSMSQYQKIFLNIVLDEIFKMQGV
eukprot:TRINITY_DN554_c0_g1_i2.p1 TRINITY_DN554_c0_g1~~TRINITY_DN554_c0_g1_i2.p1  ORF type:complete len:718 (-),score=185.46 TRINITY_DN554_c0_g1_i2:9851-12004(-)